MLYSFFSIELHERTQMLCRNCFLFSVPWLSWVSRLVPNGHVSFAVLRTDEVLKQLHPIPTSWRLRPYRTSFIYRFGHKMKRHSRACSKCLFDCETCLSLPRHPRHHERKNFDLQEPVVVALEHKDQVLFMFTTSYFAKQPWSPMGMAFPARSRKLSHLFHLWTNF